MQAKNIKAKKTNKILIIEDDHSLVELIKKRLKADGFSVLTAKSVEESLIILNSGKKIDLIWLDHYLLGKETGSDLMAILKDNNQWKNIPVFIISNSTAIDKIETYAMLGARQYYVKANHPLDEIIGDVKKVLNL